MLDYTKTAIKQTITDFKRVDYVRNIVTQILYIVYLVYVLIVGTGYFILNVALLAVSAAYFIFFLIMTSFGKTPEGRKVKKVTTAIFVWCKRLIRLVTLGLTVYGICTTIERVSAFSVVLSALMIVGWLLQIVFEVLLKFLTNRITLITDALEADIDNLLKPVRTVGNFFKKVTGQEVEQPKDPTKNQLRLRKKIDAARAEQKQKKLAERQEAAERKSEEKRISKEERERLREMKRNPAAIEESTEQKRKRRHRKRSALPEGELPTEEHDKKTERQRRKDEKRAKKEAKAALRGEPALAASPSEDEQKSKKKKRTRRKDEETDGV